MRERIDVYLKGRMVKKGKKKEIERAHKDREERERQAQSKTETERINEFQSQSEMTRGDKNENRGLDWNGWRQMERQWKGSLASSVVMPCSLAETVWLMTR